MHWYFILTEKVPRKETAVVNLKLSLLKSKKCFLLFSFFPLFEKSSHDVINRFRRSVGINMIIKISPHQGEKVEDEFVF